MLCLECGTKMEIKRGMIGNWWKCPKYGHMPYEMAPSVGVIFDYSP